MSRTLLRRAGDVALLALLAALVGFAPAARLAGADQPVPPRDRVAGLDVPVATAPADTPDVRDVPAGLTGGASLRAVEDLRPLAERALGPAGAADLMAVLADETFEGRLAESAVREDSGPAAYPYRYPRMTRLLDSAPEGGRGPASTALGAALVLLSARPEPDAPANAAAAAYAVLDRARAGGDCAAQLDLLLLVAADAQPRDVVVEEEADRARTACPSDPTPGWLEGQYLSQRAATDPHSLLDPVPADAQDRARAMLDDLAEEFPDSGRAWAAAADDRLRFAVRTVDSQPFTARHAFEDALVGYRRADALSGGSDTQPGQARALLGLGEPDEAAELLGTPTGPGVAVRLQVLLQAHEEAHDFGAAERTARRLDRLGAAGFPQGPALLPVPGGTVEAAGPVGTDRLAPLVSVELQPSPEAGGNGAVVVDASFVPDFRDQVGVTGTDADCPDWAWRRDAVLAGHARAALEDWPSGPSLWFEGLRPGHACPLLSPFRALVLAEAGRPTGLDADEAEDLADSRQNLWRWAGDLERAEEVVTGWSATAPAADPRPVQRLGEVRFLQERYDDAAASFGRAARRYRTQQWDDDLDIAETLLQRGAALLRAGRRAEAVRLLRPLEEDSARGAAYQASLDHDESSGRFAMVAYHARALLADAAQEAGELRAAVEDYDAARELVPALREVGAADFRPERVDNNAAVALAALGRGEEALDSARRAVAADPASPVFLFTAGAAADRAGDAEAAVDYARDTLASDPGAFPAANDLGVLLARQHRYAEAAAALRRAVGAAPGYALGWFNLGVVQGRRGPAYLLAAQGALARAVALDPALADRERTPTADSTTYQTGLDLSRPLPPRWSFARLQQAAPAASAGLLAALLLGVGLARSTGRGGADLAAQWLEPTTRRLDRSPALGRVRGPAWAVAVTVLVFALPALRQPSLEPAVVVTGALGVLVLTVAALRARVLLGRRRGVGTRQESWAPGMVFGLATSALGSPWAPLPVLRAEGPGQAPDPAPAPRAPAVGVHAAAPVTCGVLAAVLFAEAAWFDVPLTHSWAVAALVMTASTLLPVEPLDGARLGPGGLVGSIGVLGAALLVALGLI